MAEAQAFGKPVIAFKGGGAVDIIKDGKTGMFFDKQNKDSLKKAVENFDIRHYNEKLCRSNANRFLFPAFQEKFLSLVNNL
jgi:glycosyltransferase involved in cell wall biosynthesis